MDVFSYLFENVEIKLSKWHAFLRMTLFKVMENRDIIKLLINLNFWMNNLDIIKEQYDNIIVALFENESFNIAYVWKSIYK